MDAFEQIFKSAKVRDMATQLRSLVYASLDGIDENIVGGAKVKLVLYSRKDPHNVLCSIQEGAQDTCMLYVHHLDEIDHERLSFSGQGKHAKRIKFSDIDEIHEEDIRWLLAQLDENAPF